MGCLRATGAQQGELQMAFDSGFELKNGLAFAWHLVDKNLSPPQLLFAKVASQTIEGRLIHLILSPELLHPPYNTKTTIPMLSFKIF